MVILVTSAAVWAWSAPPDFQEHFHSALAVTTFISNFFFWGTSGYFDTESADAPLLHTWSLAVEEQFYLLFPLLVLVCVAKSRRWLSGVVIAGSAVSLLLAQWASVYAPTANFYLLPTRAWELGLGIVTAQGMRSSAGVNVQNGASARPFEELAAAAGLAGIVGSACLLTGDTPFPGLYALFPVVGAALVIRYASNSTLIGKLLQTRWLVGLGLMSYSGYLWHQPVLALARQRSLAEPNLPQQLTLTCGALGLAYFSWKYVEQPFRNRVLVPDRMARRAFLAGSVLLIGLGLYGYLGSGVGLVQYPRWLGSLGVPHKFLGLQSQGSDCSGRPPRRACQLGDPTSRRVIVLVGDSHARALTEPAELWARNHRMRLVDLTASSCPFLLGLNIYVREQPLLACNAAYQQQRLEALRNLPPAIVVIHARFPSYIDGQGFDNTVGGVSARDPVLAGTNAREDTALRLRQIAESLKRTISLVQSFGHKVIVVGPVPTNGWDPVRRLYKLERIGLATTAAERQQQMRIPRRAVVARLSTFNKMIADVRKSLPQVAYFDPVNVFCDTDWCSSISDTSVWYSDEDHLSALGAERLFKSMIATVDTSFP